MAINRKRRDVIADLIDLGVKIPKDVTAALERVTVIENHPPAAPSPDELAAAYQHVDSDPDTLRGLLVAAATQPHAAKAHAAAVSTAQATVKAALASNIDTIVEALRPDAEKCIDTITWYVSEGQPDLAYLLKVGRGKDAERAAGILDTWGRLQHLQGVRDTTLGRPRFNWSPWRNLPRVLFLDLPVSVTGFARITQAIQGGGELGWLTLTEAQEMDNLARDWQAAEHAKEAQRLKREFQSAL